MAEVVISRFRRSKLMSRLRKYLMIRGSLARLERESGVSRQSVYRVLDQYLIYKTTASKLEAALDKFMVPPFTMAYSDHPSFDIQDKEVSASDRLKSEREPKRKVRFIKCNS